MGGNVYRSQLADVRRSFKKPSHATSGSDVRSVSSVAATDAGRQLAVDSWAMYTHLLTNYRPQTRDHSGRYTVGVLYSGAEEGRTINREW